MGEGGRRGQTGGQLKGWGVERQHLRAASRRHFATASDAPHRTPPALPPRTGPRAAPRRRPSCTCRRRGGSGWSAEAAAWTARDQDRRSAAQANMRPSRLNKPNKPNTNETTERVNCQATQAQYSRSQHIPPEPQRCFPRTPLQSMSPSRCCRRPGRRRGRCGCSRPPSRPAAPWPRGRWRAAEGGGGQTEREQVRGVGRQGQAVREAQTRGVEKQGVNDVLHAADRPLRCVRHTHVLEKPRVRLNVATELLGVQVPARDLLRHQVAGEDLVREAAGERAQWGTAVASVEQCSHKRQWQQFEQSHEPA